MALYHFTFQNNDESLLNDVVYPGKEFLLKNYTYTFILKPKTNFWRLGFRLTPGEGKIPYGVNGARHSSPEFHDIHIGAGDWDNMNWSRPQRLQLVQYSFLTEPHLLDEVNDYYPMNTVALSVQYDNSTGKLHLFCEAEGSNPMYYTIQTTHEFRKFGLFAWADKRAFTIDCTIDELSLLPVVQNNVSFYLGNSTDQEVLEQTDVLLLIAGKGYTNTADTQETAAYLKLPPQSDEAPAQNVILSLFEHPWQDRMLLVGYLHVNHQSVNYNDEALIACREILAQIRKLSRAVRVTLPFLQRSLNIFRPNETAQAYADLLGNADATLSFKVIVRTQTTFEDIARQFENISAEKREKKPVLKPGYQPEGNFEQTRDQLDFFHDINSLAKVMASLDTVSPLAIGLFGNWGTGKSFFIEKLKDEIEYLRNTENNVYVKEVVQLKFNSWHYSDTNLWASLITEIFQALNEHAVSVSKEQEFEQITDVLEFAITERESLVLKKDILTKKVSELRKDKKQSFEKLKDLTGIRALKLLFRDKFVRSDLDSIKDENIELAFDDAQLAGALMEEFGRQASSLSILLEKARTMGGKRWGFVILVAVIIAALGYQIHIHYPNWLTATTAYISAGFSLILSFCFQVWRSAKPYFKAVNIVKTRLLSLKKTVESRGEPVDPELDKEEVRLRDTLDRLASIDTKINDTTALIENITSGKKLKSFIENRLGEENYLQQLGLIALIRRDFKMLDTLLREQYTMTAAQKSKLPGFVSKQTLRVDRIILYIDDLDRCNEEIVVKVLEAVHLLMAFPLFMVVVGVDPRWLNKSLKKKFAHQFSAPQPAWPRRPVQPNGPEEELYASATTYDYLEKIFQIPFALRTIQKETRERLITYLVSGEMERKNLEIGGRQDREDKKKNSANPLIKLRQGMPISSLAEASTDDTEEIPQKTFFTRKEVDYIKEVSVIFGNTPRTINRFINIFRIVKAHGGLNNSEDYSNIGCVPDLVLLSVIVGCPAESEHFIKLLRSQKDESLFKDVIVNNNGLSEALVMKLKQLYSAAELPIVSFKSNIDLISRFSFRDLF